MRQKTPLKSVLYSLSTGFTFRGKVENDEMGDLMVIQMKDLTDGYSAIGDRMIRVNSEITGRTGILERGDVLFIGKGSNNYAIEFRLNQSNVIASSAFFILRPDRATILPGYLAWYINQPTAQRYLKENTAGTYIPNINKTTLEAMMIEIPPLHVQERIVSIASLRRREHAIYEQLIKKRGELTSAALDTILRTTK